MPDLECSNCKKFWDLPEKGEDELHRISPEIYHIAQKAGIPLKETYSLQNPLPLINSIANCCKKPCIVWVIPV